MPATFTFTFPKPDKETARPFLELRHILGAAITAARKAAGPLNELDTRAAQIEETLAQMSAPRTAKEMSAKKARARSPAVKGTGRGAKGFE